MFGVSCAVGSLHVVNSPSGPVLTKPSGPAASQTLLVSFQVQRVNPRKVSNTGFSRAMPFPEAHRTQVNSRARDSESMVIGGWPTVAIV